VASGGGGNRWILVVAANPEGDDNGHVAGRMVVVAVLEGLQSLDLTGTVVVFDLATVSPFVTSTP
jgi:hypothetical protein